MAGSHAQALVVTFQKGDGEALVAVSLEEAVGVAKVEAKTDDASNRGEGDVTLLEGGDDTKLTVALGNDAIRTNQTGGIRTGMGSGEAKAGDKRTIGKTGEKVLLLLLGTVSNQELPGSQTVGDGNGGVGIEALGGKLLQHRGNGVGGKPQPAPFLGNLHSKELLGAHVIPCILGEIAVDGHVVIVEERAQGLDLVVHVGLLFGSQLGLVGVDEFL
mmetsp:Transcript_11860/g.25055  ORF Transcript_11860/g.25055 Transcript_11860/m.25055 type:complete len:216 (+) Transcript_11860:1635-2282(+)